MTKLKERIKRLIAANGPISVADYMAQCLFDPEDGYYTNREPFGTAGDFTTAPEISQMFGELVAVWLQSAWQAIGRPLPVTIAEIGPGRGTLMKDMMRTLSKLDPSLVAQASFAMIETSPRLAGIQKETLAGTQARIDWHQSIETLPENPLIIVGNELFDAVPIRQFVRANGKWQERMVGLNDADELHFLAGAASLDPTLLPANAATASDGAIAELAPARTALMDEIADTIAALGGAGLFIDYGHLEPGIGDTLQGLRKHQYEDVLASPGHADITSHVDFSALAATARGKRLDAHLMTQGHFLLEMGLLERAGQLGAAQDAAGQEKIRGQVERLAAPSAMGDLFKVLAILPSGTAVSPFSDAD